VNSVVSYVSRSPYTLESPGNGVERLAASIDGRRLEYREPVSGDVLVVRDPRLFMCNIVAQQQMKVLVWVCRDVSRDFLARPAGLLLAGRFVELAPVVLRG
jgi:selenophosphate synthetase-related protein